MGQCGVLGADFALANGGSWDQRKKCQGRGWKSLKVAEAEGDQSKRAVDPSDEVGRSTGTAVRQGRPRGKQWMATTL